MKDNKKARPGAATPERAGAEKQSSNSFLSSRSNNTIIERDKQVQIVDLLQHGEAAAIPGASLVAMLGLRDSRVLRSRIDALRKTGAVICYTTKRGGGYFLPSDDPQIAACEIEVYLHLQDKRLVSNRETTKSARAMLERLRIEASGQLRIDGGELNE